MSMQLVLKIHFALEVCRDHVRQGAGITCLATITPHRERFAFS